MKLLKSLLKIFFIVFAIFFMTAATYYVCVTKDEKLSSEKLSTSLHCIRILDADGTTLTAQSGLLSKEAVSFTELPKHTIEAFLATEDKRFFRHHGFDVRRIAKSVYVNVKSRSFQQGASTISQQLIKNTHLSQEKTLTRKLKECKLTMQLERRYTKEEIFEKYVSMIYFGHDCFGLRAACAYYFNKQPNELNLDESAILAGLVKSPNNFSPFQNPDACKKRKAVVLQLMQQNGYITQQERQAALEKPLPILSTTKSQNNTFARCVFKELSELAERWRFPIAGKLEVQTYLDSALQQESEKMLERAQTDATICVLDRTTCAVKAYASTVGEIKRLPGSLLKPLLIYAPAIEENIISPATPLLDEPIRFGGYTPQNFDGKYHGYISAREALANSLNIPAVKLLNSLGMQKAVSYLEKMGLSVENADKTLALALGGMQRGYTMTELLSAYSTFANSGLFSPCAYIESIRCNGQELYRRNLVPNRVFSEETTYLIGSMLQTAAKSGTAKKLRSLPFDIAAKTGTAGTQNGNTDAYAISYTMHDIVGVWQGDVDGGFIPVSGGGSPCNFSLEIQGFLHDFYQQHGKYIPPFPTPNTVQHIALDKHLYEHDHTLAIADPLSPPNARIFEWFKTNNAPRTHSDLYTQPTLCDPSISYQDNCVKMQFKNIYQLPYQLEIERIDCQSNQAKIVFSGNFTDEFNDDTILPDKKYIYKITPMYHTQRGKTITLPAINTKKEEKTSPHDREIIGKDWWEY